MHLSAFLQFGHFTDCSIREYRSIMLSILKYLPIMLALCTQAYYAFYFAGIFDAGLQLMVHNYRSEKANPHSGSNCTDLCVYNRHLLGIFRLTVMWVNISTPQIIHKENYIKS